MELEEHETVLILPTPIPSSLWLRSRFRFSGDFQWIGRALTTLTPTPSLVKIHLYRGQYALISFCLILIIRCPMKVKWLLPDNADYLTVFTVLQDSTMTNSSNYWSN